MQPTSKLRKACGRLPMVCPVSRVTARRRSNVTATIVLLLLLLPSKLAAYDTAQLQVHASMYSPSTGVQWKPVSGFEHWFSLGSQHGYEEIRSQQMLQFALAVDCNTMALNVC